jgi:hypothetical protein
LAIFEDDAEEDDDVPESLSADNGASNGFSSSSKENVIIRKSFPESWIFDGNLELGYKYCFIFEYVGLKILLRRKTLVVGLVGASLHCFSLFDCMSY